MVDILLLVITIVNVLRGHSSSHGSTLVPFYVGFSVAWGHRIIKWCDRYILFKLGKGAAPKTFIPTIRKQRVVYESQKFLLDIIAVTLISTILILCIYFGGGINTLTMPFVDSFKTLGVIAVILLIIDVNYIIFQKD